MNRVQVVVVVAVLLSVLAGDASACQRCGLFGNRCRLVTQHHVQQVAVAPVAVVRQPELLVVQNNFPQPIAAQGQTLYGYQSAAAAYTVNPAETLRQAAELSKAASATASLGISGFNELAQTQLTLQARIAEPLVKSQAAAQVLNAAGLSHTAPAQQSLALRIYQDGGQWKVENAEAAQVNARIEARVGTSASASPLTPAASTNSTVSAEAAGKSILSQKCAACHGVKLAQPKGELFVDAGHKLDCSAALKSIRLIRSGEMPKDGTLTDAEKAAAIDELLSLANLGGD